MRKTLLLALLTVCSLLVQAEEKRGAMCLTTPANYQILSISENGLWACGNYSDDSDTGYGFRWNLSTGKIDLLEAGSTSYTVANDGTIAGSYYTTEVTGSSMEVPATWNGKWTMLELPNNKGGWATGITPDGQYVTGTDNSYVSYIWKNGKLQHTAKVKGIVPEANGTFIVYSISPDGTKIGGWAYYSDDNRNPGYWDATDQQFHELNPGNPGSPWQCVRKFTPDGKKLLFWGGYEQDPSNPGKGYGIKAIHDLTTQTNEYVYPIWQDPFNFDLYDIGGKGSVVGYIQDSEGMEYGIINNNGQTRYIVDYLKEMGASFDGLNIATDANDRPMLFRTMSISGDEKTLGMIYYDNSYEYHSIVVMLDKNTAMTPPVNVEGRQMPGIMAASLTWSQPLGDKSTLKGYNIYRDGVKVNSSLVTTTKYYDKNLTVGTHSYTVSAVYDEGESEQSEATTLTLKERTPNAPNGFMARQKGYQSVYAVWDTPSTNFIENNYYSDGSHSLDGFGGGSISFESGTLFDAEQISLYDGFRVVGVSFIPGTEQGSWIINIYRHVDGVLTLLKSVPVTQPLNYGSKNVVMLPQPLKLQAGQDLLIGIQTNVTQDSYNVQAVYEGCLKVGYTDLLRQVGEADFFSINEKSNGETYDMAWATSALLSPENESSELDKIDHYTVYVNNVKKGETKEMSYEDATLTEGYHTIGIQTNYADGRNSNPVNTTIKVAKNEEVLKITPTITTGMGKMNATWEAPKDDDHTVMGYCNDRRASRSPNATADVTELIARVDFTPTELKSYDGYQIQSLSFYPMSNSCYELQVFEDDVQLIAIPVDEFVKRDWNTLKLEEPIAIQKNKTYRYCVVCYDCPANEPPLAIDSRSSRNDYSCLLQAGGEDGWYLISEETGLDGNWMMRMNIALPNAKDLAVSGYDVYVDGRKSATTQSTEFTEIYNSDDTAKHTLRVDANYTDLGKIITGNTFDFYIVIPTAIEQITDANDTNAMLYNIAGQKVGKNYKGLIISDGKKRVER